MNLYPLSILTLEKVFFRDSVYSVHVPGAEGYLEILAHHAPLITLLQPGKLVIVDKNQERHTYTVSSGFVEVSHNQVTIIVDTIEKWSETSDLAHGLI